MGGVGEISFTNVVIFEHFLNFNSKSINQSINQSINLYSPMQTNNKEVFGRLSEQAIAQQSWPP